MSGTDNIRLQGTHQLTDYTDKRRIQSPSDYVLPTDKIEDPDETKKKKKLKHLKQFEEFEYKPKKKKKNKLKGPYNKAKELSISTGTIVPQSQTVATDMYGIL